MLGVPFDQIESAQALTWTRRRGALPLVFSASIKPPRNRYFPHARKNILQ
jgi:hypothetical protein